MNNKNSNFKTSGLIPVLFAFLGNLFICCIKFFGFFISGSSALFSEAVHSLADTSNQFLLVIGIRKSVKQADDKYNYGYGRERFVWALISACGIFFVGCGITVYHGLNILMHPESIKLNNIIFYILIASFIIESITFYIAYRHLRKQSHEKKWSKILKYGDPTTLAVLYEDGLAVLGVLIALLGIMMSHLTGKIYWDAISSIIIGLMLGVMAIILIAKNRNYLLTKSIPDDMRERVIEILEMEPTIEKVLDFKSSVVDINKYLIKCDIEFNAAALMKYLDQHDFLDHEYEKVKDDYNEFMKFCVDFMDRVPRMVGREIDKIEKKIKDEFPEIVFIDIEIN
ncbi:MAG: cation diffusion facilitator family transporter [Candidatus Falkowbacteria bacterium]